MFMLDIKDYSWWYWVATSLSLWTTMTATPEAYNVTMAIAVVQLVHFRLVKGSFSDLSVQIRLGFVSYLLLCLPENFQCLLWLPTIGSLARVLFGYCLMGRMLLLLPFNRQVKLSMKFVLDVFLTPPVKGSILQGIPALKVM